MGTITVFTPNIRRPSHLAVLWGRDRLAIGRLGHCTGQEHDGGQNGDAEENEIRFVPSLLRICFGFSATDVNVWRTMEEMRLGIAN